MSEQVTIRYYKWNKKEYTNLSRSIQELLSIRQPQFYMPFFSLYFYIHNSPLSVKKIDMERRYYLRSLGEIIKERYYNSNTIIKGGVYDSNKNIIEEKDIFCKSIPILDPIHLINNNYNLVIKNNYHLPGAYNYNTFNKINDMNNGAYIDVFCSYIFGQLVSKNISPSFALFYGSLNGIGDYKYDMTEEYDDLKIDKCFNDNLGRTFKLDIYLSDSESESDSNSDSESDSKLDPRKEDSIGENSDKENSDEENSDEENSDEENSDEENSDEGNSYNSYSNEDYIAKIKNIPIQLLFIEKLEGTLEDYLLDEGFKEEVLLSCLFQISFALHYLQKHYEFTHNDLHINNIMFSTTERKYLYYKYNNKYFRVPTHGKIFKIIDFGRSIFTYKGKVFMNDVFSKNGEAGGQYYYPPQVKFHKEDELCQRIKPNYCFDLCRLSMTILDEIDMDKVSKKMLTFLNHICTDKYDNNFCDMEDDFSLYILIAKNAENSLPINIINKDIFKEYLVKKKKFPLKSYYSL